jgi:hypothetical protein
VFKKSGIKTEKQEVIVGETNANDAVILGGLAETDRIYLSVPSGLENAEIALLEEMSGKRKKNQPDEVTDATTQIIPAGRNE